MSPTENHLLYGVVGKLLAKCFKSKTVHILCDDPAIT
jgi:hypothetical protein